MNRCFIFSAGSFFGLREVPGPDDYTIAADAGLLLCRQLGIVPDMTIGDYDSMEEPSALPHIRVPVEKDDTDTMLALKMGLDKGCRNFYFYGATGGKRMDHTLACLQGLSYLCRHDASGILYDHDFAYTVIENSSLRIAREVNWGILSVFSLDRLSKGVTLKGVQYPLENRALEQSFPLGVSNHFISPVAEVSVQEGMLLIGWELKPQSDF